MLLKKIAFLKDTPFKPHAKPSNKLIRPQLQRLLKSIDYIDTPPITKRNKYIDLKQIAAAFKVKLHILPNLKTAGAALPDRNLFICVRGLNKKMCSPERIRQIFCHELGHILQIDARVWIPNAPYSLSDALQLEQEAESAAIVLYRTLFPEFEFKRSSFKSYFSEEDILYLKKYLEEGGEKVTNDLFLLKNEKERKKSKKRKG